MKKEDCIRHLNGVISKLNEILEELGYAELNILTANSILTEKKVSKAYDKCSALLLKIERRIRKMEE